MSEYQYYEFRTVDRNLTADEIEKLDQLSSRAEVTATGFSVTYNYGDFRGDPERLMERYFDAFVYVANWGTRRFMARLPKRAIDLSVLEAFGNEAFTFWTKGDFVVVSFEYNDDGEGDGEWEQGEDWMPELIGLREELLNGDYRSLYLGWLSGVSYDEEYDSDDADELEPPVPPGLNSLTDAQDALAAFLQMDVVLIEAAAQSSSDLPQAESVQSQLSSWLQAIPAKKKDTWLLELLSEPGWATRAEILLEFREAQRKAAAKPGSSATKLRSIKELFAAREAHLEVYERRVAKEEANEKAKAARQVAKKRTAELDALSKRVDEAWREIETTLASTSQKRFINAVEVLTNLRDVAERDGQLDAYRVRLEKLQKRHADKPAFQSRVSKANLMR